MPGTGGELKTGFIQGPFAATGKVKAEMRPTKDSNFSTTFYINDVNTDKKIAAKTKLNKFEKGKEPKYVAEEYEAPKDPIFRTDELRFN